MIIKYGRHWGKFTRCAKVCGLFFYAFRVLIGWAGKCWSRGRESFRAGRPAWIDLQVTDHSIASAIISYKVLYGGRMIPCVGHILCNYQFFLPTLLIELVYKRLGKSKGKIFLAWRVNHFCVQMKQHLQKHELCSAITWTPPLESTHRERSFEWSHL